ncbi:MAG: metal-sulfur cluster assembly factor [Bacteroidota bacterium]
MALMISTMPLRQSSCRRKYQKRKAMESENKQSKEITKEAVYAALKDVYDPEIPVSIVDLGLVYDVKIIDDWVGVKMTLTSPGCGLSNQIANNVRERVASIQGVHEADVRIVWEPQWSPDMMSEEAKKKVQFFG